MAYPVSLDELTDGVPSDGTAAATSLGDATYQHDDHHRALAVAVEAVEAELGTAPSGASATVAARFGTLTNDVFTGAVSFGGGATVTGSLTTGSGGIVGQIFTSNAATGTSVAGYGTAATFVTAGGFEAGKNGTGVSHTLWGREAGSGATGSYLAMFGHIAGFGATGSRVVGVGYGAAYLVSGSDVVAVGDTALLGSAHSNVIGLGTNVVSTASNQMIVGVAGNAINTWVPGHDPDTYLDFATADTVKHYCGGVKVLELNETGSAPLMGFFGTAAQAKPTGVAVSAAGIHAALVTLGLIAA